MLIDFDIPGDWTVRPLCDTAKIILSNVDKIISQDELPVRLCNYTDVYYNDYINASADLSKGSAKPHEIGRFQLKADDVLITKDSEDRHDIAVPAIVLEDLPNVLCGYHLAIVRPKNGLLCAGYLAELLQHHRIQYYFSCLANGVTRFGLTNDSISYARIPIPPLLEQIRIAEIGKAHNDAIKHIKSLIKQKRLTKKGLMQQLLTGKQRFPEFSDSQWNERKLAEFLVPNTRPVPKPGNPFKSLGIRSHGKGIFHKPDFEPNSIALDELYRVEANDLIVNITFAWEGAIAVANEDDDGALVSHRFPTFQFKTDVMLPEYFKHVILRKRFIYELGVVSPGGAGRNRVLNKKDFLKIQVLVPCMEEQRKIASVLDTCDREIALVEAQDEISRRQKKGLMQKLLTGQIRVKGD